jgi:hypothetical protein
MTRLIPLLLGFMLLGGLTGCETWLAGAITDASSLQERARVAIGKNLDFRAWVRDKCQESVKREVHEKFMTGDEDGARELLAEAYPPLFVVSMWKSSGKTLSEARACVFDEAPESSAFKEAIMPESLAPVGGEAESE